MRQGLTSKLSLSDTLAQNQLPDVKQPPSYNTHTHRIRIMKTVSLRVETAREDGGFGSGTSAYS